ncbi:alpha/beta hydrolase family protein [Bradyrhizobium sp. USDA 4354]
MFLDNLSVKNIHGSIGRKNAIVRWTKAGDDHCLVADQNIKKGAFDDAIEAWLCALTAFEVARRLTDENDAQGGEGAARVEASIQRFTLLLDQKVERIKIARCDKTEFLGHYFPARRDDSCCPAVICISHQQETGAMLLGRLLPVLIGRGMSVLAISHEDVSSRSRGQSEILLSCCLDFLAVQAGVDPTRIGVYGDGLSATLATHFAASDPRVAAAVCDGGLWSWTRTLASVAWMTTAADAMEEEVVSMRRSQLARRLRCPVLVVAGGRGVVSVSEAIKLQVDCMAAGIDLQLVMPRMIRILEEEVENFVMSDNCIFEWLEQKLARTSSS